MSEWIYFKLIVETTSWKTGLSFILKAVHFEKEQKCVWNSFLIFGLGPNAHPMSQIPQGKWTIETHYEDGVFQIYDLVS